MSRGPGRIERALYHLFEEHPEGAWTTADLCRLIYPTANRVEKKHRVAVLRAMDKVIDKKGDQHRDWGWFYFGFKGAAARVLCNYANVMSYSLAKLNSMNAKTWVGEEWRTRTEEELLERLQPGGDHHGYIIPGPRGHWDRHVRMYIAKRDGDQETADKMKYEQDMNERIADAQLRQIAASLR